MMMQILRAADVEVVHNTQEEIEQLEKNIDFRKPVRPRISKEANPNGFFEWAKTNDIGKNPEILTFLDGKAVKIFAVKLCVLPQPIKNCKVIYMDRDSSEMVASWKKEYPFITSTNGVELLDNRREVVKQKFVEQGYDVLYIWYSDIVSNPEPSLIKICDFLNIDKSKMGAMRDAIDPKLYRNRKA